MVYQTASFYRSARFNLEDKFEIVNDADIVQKRKQKEKNRNSLFDER